MYVCVCVFGMPHLMDLVTFLVFSNSFKSVISLSVLQAIFILILGIYTFVLI